MSIATQMSDMREKMRHRCVKPGQTQGSQYVHRSASCKHAILLLQAQLLSVLPHGCLHPRDIPAQAAPQGPRRQSPCNLCVPPCSAAGKASRQQQPHRRKPHNSAPGTFQGRAPVGKVAGGAQQLQRLCARGRVFAGWQLAAGDLAMQRGARSQGARACARPYHCEPRQQAARPCCFPAQQPKMRAPAESGNNPCVRKISGHAAPELLWSFCGKHKSPEDEQRRSIAGEPADVR